MRILYDVTPLYPGTPYTGVDDHHLGWCTHHCALRPEHPSQPGLGIGCTTSATEARSATSAPGRPGRGHQCVRCRPDKTRSPRRPTWFLPGLPPIKFLGHHYFDFAGVPTFDLTSAQLFASLTKTGQATASSDADKGILKTGAVAWLQLTDTGKGASRGVQLGTASSPRVASRKPAPLPERVSRACRTQHTTGSLAKLPTLAIQTI